MNTAVSLPMAVPGRNEVLPKLRRILVATDFSSLSWNGIFAAISLAHGAPGASVELIHVIDPQAGSRTTESGAPLYLGLEKCVEEAEGELDLLRLTFGQVQHFHGRVVTGHVARTICKVAQQEDFDLVVLCSHGGSGLESMSMGHVAEQVLTEACRPVLLVKPSRSGTGQFVTEPAPIRWREILVGYDHRAGSALALAAARAVAQGMGGQLTLLQALIPLNSGDPQNVLNDDDHYALRHSLAMGELGQVCAELMPESKEWKVRAVRGYPEEALANYARDAAADLIVVGPHEASHRTPDFSGSTAHLLACAASCSVLVVKQAKEVQPFARCAAQPATQAPSCRHENTCPSFPSSCGRATQDSTLAPAATHPGPDRFFFTVQGGH